VKKKPLTNKAPPATIADAPQAEGFDFDRLLATLRENIKLRIKAITEQPSTEAKAAAVRARDSRTLEQLVQSMERITVLEKRREKMGKKAKSRKDAELKEQVVRRLDQLLAAQGPRGVSEEPERR
jgi:uncharacterized protein YlxW (UPF0749 family)